MNAGPTVEADVRRWMERELADDRDYWYAGEADRTRLGEAASEAFDLSDDETGQIPAWVWDVAHEVAEAAEARGGR